MTNREIAKIIEDIGDMLEILGEEKDQFRIIAYQNAARKIEMISRELSDIYKEKGEKGVRQIKGIGESIAKTIEEILKTGKSKYHQQLTKKVSPAILEFTRIPGVGPHLAKDIFDNYKVKTIPQLKKILAEETSDKIFKEKTRQNILQGIDLLSRQTGRMLLSFAEPIALEVITALKKMKEVSQAHPVGSLRRMKETIGDIDVVSDSFHPAKTIEEFIHQPFVESIIAHGDTKATIMHKKGIQVDLEILPKDEYGSLLQHFTGSKDHNIALRTWAEKHGFSLSEHGIKKGGKTVKYPKEEEFYQALGMDWIPPELRENRGEIEVALKHKLPKLVELKDIKGDLHLHTTWSEGEVSIEVMAKEAQKMGYQYIGITDHTAGLGITHGLKEKDIPRYLKEIEKINSKLKILNPKQIQNLQSKIQNKFSTPPSPLSILSGVEVNILADGSLDISNQMLEKLDLVIASIHSGFRQSKEKVTERLIKTIKNPHVDMIGHPSGRLIERRQPLDLDWQKIFQTAAETKTVMEINSHPERLDLNDDLSRMAKKMGIKIIINTDAHQLNHLQNMRYGVATARRGWLEKKDILNTLPVKDLLKQLK